MKFFFAGSPPSSALILEILTKRGVIPSLVITQPDRPHGRNRKIKPSEVAVQAEKLGIDTVKPEKLDEEFINSISEHGKPDFILVSAYGKILPSKLLELKQFTWQYFSVCRNQYKVWFTMLRDRIYKFFVKFFRFNSIYA